jgi:hypothetical protein
LNVEEDDEYARFFVGHAAILGSWRVHFEHREKFGGPATP